MTGFTPLIADWVYKDPDTGAVLTEVRFDSVERQNPPKHPHLPHMSVEPLTAGPDTTIPVEQWLHSVESIRQFVERAFFMQRELWPRDLDPDLEVKFDVNGTRVHVEALLALGPGTGKFDRTTIYSEIDGVRYVTLKAWDASGPMRLRSWVVYQNAVNSLIELNNGGSGTLGL
jgi:hypothetical protein